MEGIANITLHYEWTIPEDAEDPALYLDSLIEKWATDHDIDLDPDTTSIDSMVVRDE